MRLTVQRSEERCGVLYAVGTFDINNSGLSLPINKLIGDRLNEI